MNIFNSIFSKIFSKDKQTKYYIVNDFRYPFIIESNSMVTYESNGDTSTVEMPLFEGMPQQYIEFKNNLKNVLYTNAICVEIGTLISQKIEDKTRTRKYHIPAEGNEKLSHWELIIVEVEKDTISTKVDIKPVITLLSYMNEDLAMYSIGLISN